MMTLISQRFLHSLHSPSSVPMIVKANRCSGKTELLCMLAAKLALESYKVCIVFSCKHLVVSSMEQIVKLMPNAQCKDNRVNASFGGGWVHCGKNVVDEADIFMVDEIGYMDPNIFYEALAPKVCMINKPMLLIGTPTGNTNNLMARLCKLKDKYGSHIFNVIDITSGAGGGERCSLL